MNNKKNELNLYIINKVVSDNVNNNITLLSISSWFAINDLIEKLNHNKIGKEHNFDIYYNEHNYISVNIQIILDMLYNAKKISNNSMKLLESLEISFIDIFTEIDTQINQII